MNKVIKGVRIHSQPRQKLYDHKWHKKFNRLTVILTNDGKPHVKDDGLQRDNGQTKDQWCGLTIFYHDKQKYDEDVTEVMYLDTPIGLAKVNLTHEENRNVKDVYETWMNNVYELVLKPSQKELSPRFFNEDEKRKFAAADLAEWRQFINQSSCGFGANI